jgi:energy-coupling factor transporter ATP-binding protein EcfA2
LHWLWTHEKYQAWSSIDTSDLLLIEGKPGSGKSTLTKYFKRNILEQEPLARKSIVASFFYSNREGELQTDHANMLRSILYDILMQNETFFFHFQPYFRKAIHPGKRFQWPYAFLKKILLSLQHHPAQERLYFIIDAMDESDDNDRREIIQLLHQLCSTRKPCVVKVFLASRPISPLNHPLVKIDKTIRLQDMNEPDIIMFAKSFLGPELEFPPKILDEATEYIVQNAQGVFIWVALVKEKMLIYAERGCTPMEIFRFLRSLPTKLEEFYNCILRQLENGEPRDIEHGVKMFRLVLFGYRPLRVAELHHALAIPDNLDVEFTPDDELFEGQLILGIDKRIIHCGGNFLEIKGHSGMLFLESPIGTVG